jgi:hypothetical protein
MHTRERESSGSSGRCVTCERPWSNRSSPLSKMAFGHPCACESGGCPTLKFTILPLHAAGPYRNEKNLMDIYISSYASSLASHSCGRLWNRECDFVRKPGVKAGRVGI